MSFNVCRPFLFGFGTYHYATGCKLDSDCLLIVLVRSIFNFELIHVVQQVKHLSVTKIIISSVNGSKFIS